MVLGLISSIHPFVAVWHYQASITNFIRLKSFLKYIFMRVLTLNVVLCGIYSQWQETTALTHVGKLQHAGAPVGTPAPLQECLLSQWRWAPLCVVDVSHTSCGSSPTREGTIHTQIQFTLPGVDLFALGVNTRAVGPLNAAPRTTRTCNVSTSCQNEEAWLS